MNILSIVLLSVGGSTVFGILLGLLVRRLPHRWNDIVLGLSAGIMLAAAALGLLAPAFAGSPSGICVPVLGAIVGAGLISLLDRIVPHLHRLAGLDGESHPTNGSISKTLLFVAALALHKIPEGLATGVSFGTESVGDVLTVAGAISLQNVPEAFVVVAPLFAIGISSRRVVGFSLSIALVSIVSVLCGYALVSVFSDVLPFLLAAAGARCCMSSATR